MFLEERCRARGAQREAPTGVEPNSFEQSLAHSDDPHEGQSMTYLLIRNHMRLHLLVQRQLMRGSTQEKNEDHLKGNSRDVPLKQQKTYLLLEYPQGV